MVSRFERITTPVHEFFGYPDDRLDINDFLEAYPLAVHGVPPAIEVEPDVAALLEANRCGLRFDEPSDVGVC